MGLRVTHCPVNLAGVGWTNVQALRKRGVDARLVVFNTQPFRPDQADWDLKRPRKGLLRQQLVQWRAFSKLLASPTVATSALAVIGPMPGIFSSLQLSLLERCQTRI